VRPSPDRRQLAYIARDDLVTALPRLWVVATDGSARRAISAPGSSVADPAWSPDGRSIVYVDGKDLRLVDVRSGRDRRLAGVRGSRLWLPSIRPDGRTILYTRVARHGERLELWTIPVRGGSSRLLLRDAAYGTWAPDGEHIAFRRFERAVRAGSIWPYRWGGLYIMDGDGGDVRTLIEPSGWMMAPLDWSAVRPEWSPSGSRLVFAVDPGPDSSVRLVDVGTRHVTHVTCGYGPSWWNDRALILEGTRPCRSTGGTAIDLADTVAMR
jgi:Tol biopolymer transport system component